VSVRIAALTSGGRHTPSTRFRIRQHIAPLAELGISVHEFSPIVGDAAERFLLPLRPRGTRLRQVPYLYPLYVGLLGARIAARVPGVAGSWRYDVTWLERGLCGGWPTLEKVLSKPLVLDVDDAVWLAPPFGTKQMQRTAERADVVMVCNTFLADWFSRFCPRVELVPTAVDGDVFFPEQKPDASPFTVGWTGTSGNFRYLDMIREALLGFLRHAPAARLRVVADAVPSELNLPSDRVEYIRWSEANEAATVQSMDVGIMPLADDAWAKGKCAFKAIQYMACGVPVVASPVGMTSDVFARGEVGLAARTPQEWLDALTFLYEHRDEARRLGAAGRATFLAHYDRAVATRRIAEIFNSIC
jgi:glycosyltransferase involved in cell wall biosynthesis